MVQTGIRRTLQLRAATGVMTCLLASGFAFGQTSMAAQTALTDVQAAALLRTLAAGQGNGAGVLSTAQMQLLSQYLQRQSQRSAGTVAAGAGQPAMALQANATESVAAAAPAMATQPPATTAGQKKAGTIRIGVVAPTAQMGQGNSGTNVAEPLRFMLIKDLSGPAYEAVPISAVVDTQVNAEAAQADCDYVLYTSMTQKANSSGMGMLNRAMPFARMIPVVGPLASVATSAAGVVAMSGAAGLTSAVKAKSEVDFEYKLVKPGSATAIAASSLRAKAKQDGEDIVSPLIAQAAGAVLAAVSNKN